MRKCSASRVGWQKERNLSCHKCKIVFFKKSSMIQSMNLGWICEYQNKETTCVETSMPVIWTTFRCVLILFWVLLSEDRAEATYIFSMNSGILMESPTPQWARHPVVAQLPTRGRPTFIFAFASTGISYHFALFKRLLEYSEKKRLKSLKKLCFLTLVFSSPI